MSMKEGMGRNTCCSKERTMGRHTWSSMDSRSIYCSMGSSCCSMESSTGSSTWSSMGCSSWSMGSSCCSMGSHSTYCSMGSRMSSMDTSSRSMGSRGRSTSGMDSTEGRSTWSSSTASS